MAAIAATNLTNSGGTLSSGSSFNTASISPTANCLVVLSVYQKRGAGNGTTPTASGASMTWTQINTIAANSSQRITLFRALSSSPGTGAITISFGGVTQDNVAWSIDQFTNVVTTGTNGADAVVQNATNSSAGATSLTATLSSLGNTENVAYGLVGTDGGSSMTKGANFTQLANMGPTGGQANSEWAKNQTAVNWTWTSSVPCLAMAIEVKNKPSAGFFQFF